MPSGKTTSNAQPGQLPASPSLLESLTFLGHLDSRLGMNWPFSLSDGEPGLFEPLVFLRGDEGSFLSLFEAVVNNYDFIFEEDRRDTVLSHELSESKRKKLMKMRGWGPLVSAELSRRGLRAALGLEDNPERPGTVAKARNWILENDNPVPYLEMKPDAAGFRRRATPLLFLGQDERWLVGPDSVLYKARQHFLNYIENQTAGLTTRSAPGDIEPVTKRQEQPPERDSNRDLLDDATLPPSRRHGEERFLTPYKGLSLATLRNRMKNAVKKSGLSYTQIAEEMGLDPRNANPRSEIYRLLNFVMDPGLFTVLRFCDAVHISPGELLAPQKTKK